ncbi:MAG: hypothetical protein M0P01_14160 [Treponema sp.]|nr:hypothetical protein [Treponema sp.]
MYTYRTALCRIPDRTVYTVLSAPCTLFVLHSRSVVCSSRRYRCKNFEEFIPDLADAGRS